jgi:hypothetical protein
MKPLSIRAFFTLLIIISFSGCVGAKKDTQIQIPKWFLNPPANNITTLYGTGEGKSLADAKNNALKDMSEKLVITVASSVNSITTTSYDGVNSNYLKENIKNVKVDAKKITFSNYKTSKAIQSDNSFFVMVNSARNELFNEQKKEFDLIDDKINSTLKTLQNKSKLEKIHLLQNLKPTLIEGKNKAFILYAIENSFAYQTYHKKYDDITNEIDFLKNNLTIQINSNLKIDPYKEHITALLNQNNYKTVPNNAEVIININSNVRYSKARGWDIAKVATTLNVTADNKTSTNQTINTLGRSSSSKKNALVSSGDRFKKEIEKQGVDKIIFGK